MTIDPDFHPFPKYKPEAYDLLKLLTDKGKLKTGWWVGKEFYCRTLTTEEKIIAWKKQRTGY